MWALLVGLPRTVLDLALSRSQVPGNHLVLSKWDSRPLDQYAGPGAAQSQLDSSLETKWPWENYFIIFSLSVVICKMLMIRLLSWLVMVNIQ